MKRTGAIWRKLKILAVAAVTWTAMHAAAWAQQDEEPAETAPDVAGKYWVMSWFLVLLCVALGMLLVCRSARRAERAKPKDYGE